MVKNSLKFVEALEGKGFKFAEFSPCEWAFERHKNGRAKKDGNGNKILVVEDGKHKAVPQRKIKLPRPDSELIPEWFKGDFQGGWLGIPKGTEARGGSFVIDVDSKDYPDDLLGYNKLTIIVPTAKGNHVYVLYKDSMRAEHRKVELDGIPCDLAWSGFGKEGQGVYLPPFAKYRDAETLEAPITHDIEDGMLDARPLAFLSGSIKDRIEVGGDKYTKQTVRKQTSKSKDADVIDPYVKDKIQVNAGRWDTLVKKGFELMNRGWDGESREYVLKLLNDEYLEEPYDDANVHRLLDDITAAQRKEKKKCPYRLVCNSHEDTTPGIIEKCMEAMKYEFRVNVRGGLLEGRKGDGEWMTKEPRLWRSYLRVDFQKHLLHSLKIHVKIEGGEYKGTTIKADHAKFTAQDIQEVFDIHADAQEYDPMRDYLHCEAIQEKLEALRKKHMGESGKIIDVKKLPAFQCLHKIVQYERNDYIAKQYPLVDREYWEWTLWMATFPVVYNTHNPGKRFSEVVLLMGPQGSFKTSLFEYLLPENLRHMVIKGSFLDDEKEMFRKIDQSVFFIIDELDGYWNNEEKSLRILASRADEYRPLWKEGVRIALRRGSVFATTNDEAPLKMSRDQQRRWNPASFNKNEQITERGIKEGKTAQGFVDYAEEWGDEWREWIWASLLLMYECGWQPGLPYGLNEKREEAVKMASGQSAFRDVVMAVVQAWRNDGNEAIDMPTLFEKLPFKRNKEKAEIALDIIAEMGGNGKLKAGRYTIKDKDGFPINKNQQYIDIKNIPVLEDCDNGDVGTRDNDNPEDPKNYDPKWEKNSKIKALREKSAKLDGIGWQV